MSLAGVTFKNPVLIDLLDGTVFSLKNFQLKQDSITFKKIPMADFPFIIAEKDQIEIAQ